MDILAMDPIMTLSLINMKLRDMYSTLDMLCDDLDISKDKVISKLKAVGYEYDEDLNQFK